MKPLIQTLLWGVAGAWLAFKSYQLFHNPWTNSGWFTPYANLLMALLAFSCAFDCYRHRGNARVEEPGSAPDPLTRSERILFRVFGLPLIIIGLAAVGLGCWMTWGEWVKVAQWPRTNAILMSKDISKVGARLVFQYEVGGERFTGVGFRWGSERAVRAALESYKPGTIQKIIYDPQNPGEVETILRYSWELLRVPIFAVVFGAFFIAGGVVVYRWSYDVPSTRHPVSR